MNVEGFILSYKLKYRENPHLVFCHVRVLLNPGESAALVILDCICKQKIKIGLGKLAQILHDSKAQDILNCGMPKPGWKRAAPSSTPPGW